MNELSQRLCELLRFKEAFEKVLETDLTDSTAKELMDGLQLLNDRLKEIEKENI